CKWPFGIGSAALLSDQPLVFVPPRYFLRSFFFSSRRRHTRWPRDWSSDVCSSDLHGGDEVIVGAAAEEADRVGGRLVVGREAREIGRASCRERVETSVVGVIVNKKRSSCEEATRLRLAGSVTSIIVGIALNNLS